MRKSELVLSLALLGSVAVAVGLWNELRAQRDMNVRLAAQPDIPEVVARDVPDVSSHALPAAPAAQPTATVATAVTTENTPPPATPPAVAGERAAGKNRHRQLLNDPRYREALREQRRLTYSLRRDNIIRLANLTPEQADAVIELQIERELTQMEGMVTYPDGSTHHQYSQEREDAARLAYESKLRELLGSKYDGLQQYMESRGSRMQVDRFRTQLAGADMLREDQVEPLIAALHVEQSRMHSDLGEYQRTLNWDGDSTETMKLYHARESELQKEAHARMHTAASAVLSPSQLTKLDAMLRRDREQRATQQRIDGLQAKIRSATPVAGEAD